MEFKFQGSPLVADVSAGLIMSNQSLVLQRVREDYGDNKDDDGDGDGDDENDEQGVPLKLFSYQMIQISKHANFTLSLNNFQSLYQPLDNVQSLSLHVCIVYIYVGQQTAIGHLHLCGT